SPAIDPEHPPYEVHVRGAARCATREAAEAVAHEIEMIGAVWSPFGSAGTHKTRISQVVGTVATYLDRDMLSPKVTVYEL
ncbi:hypothetical protein, partial [Cellulosimicrobium sp. KWT-B]|uniref:hypothetical protein n=1 Tax=Cellulosimicrobium sp. KWT-B TaxID=1981152 RepID=UPI0018E9D368